MKLTVKSVPVFAILVAALAMAGSALANGLEFFTPDDSNAQTYFYYFGHVKDSHGKPLEGVTVNISLKSTAMATYVVPLDSPGHFRTPDIGQLIMGGAAGQEKIINPGNIQITVSKKGYRQVSPTMIPVNSRAPKAIEVEFVMEQVDSASK